MNRILRSTICRCQHQIHQRSLRYSSSTSSSSPDSTLPILSPSTSDSTVSSAAPSIPWFVDPSTLPSSSTASTTATTALPTFIPLPPPDHLPSSLHSLHRHLASSPFLNPTTLTYINAREADPENAWTEWIVVSSLKVGREGGLRGAIEGVRVFLTTSPIELSPSPAPSPFSPPSSIPLITGLPTSLSSHARSRAKAPSSSRIEQASDGWAMLDAGHLVVHVMTEEGRMKWGLESLWDKIKLKNKVVEGNDEIELE